MTGLSCEAQTEVGACGHGSDVRVSLVMSCGRGVVAI